MRDFMLENKIIIDSLPFVQEAVAEGKNIICEGGGGIGLDVDYGTYPYTFSGSCSIGKLFSGLGIPYDALDTTVGVCKAYTTRHGNGPYPAEI